LLDIPAHDLCRRAETARLATEGQKGIMTIPGSHTGLKQRWRQPFLFIHNSKSGGKTFKKASKSFLGLRLCSNKQGRASGFNSCPTKEAEEALRKRVRQANASMLADKCNLYDFECDLTCLDTGVFYFSRAITFLENPMDHAFSTFAHGFLERHTMTPSEFIDKSLKGESVDEFSEGIA